MRGRFISIEGGEAVGKSTQIRLLADWVRREGREITLTREPGGTDSAEAIKTSAVAEVVPEEKKEEEKAEESA